MVTDGDNPLFTSPPSIAPDGTLTYTPAPNAHGTATVTAKLIDNGGGADTSAVTTFTITVNAVNDGPPVFNSPPVIAVDVGAPYLYGVSVTGPDGDSPQISVESLPAGFSFVDHTDGTADLANPITTVGSFSVVLTATDEDGDVTKQSFTIVVNGPPVFTSTPVTQATVGSIYTYLVRHLRSER